MIVVLRGLLRLATVLVFGALALAGLALAIFAIGDSHDFSLPALARYVRLPELRDFVGDHLRRLEVDHGFAEISFVVGALAVLVGLAFVVAALVPRRERLVPLEESERGRIDARKRALRDAFAALVSRQHAVTDARVRVRPRYRGPGGRVDVLAYRSRARAPELVEENARTAVAQLASDFSLEPRVRTRVGQGRRRVS